MWGYKMIICILIGLDNSGMLMYFFDKLKLIFVVIVFIYKRIEKIFYVLINKGWEMNRLIGW